MPTIPTQQAREFDEREVMGACYVGRGARLLTAQQARSSFPVS